MTSNPNNYEGATTSIVGRAGGPAEEVFNGSTRLSIAVGQGYKKNGEWIDHPTNPTVWYTVQAATEYAEQHWPDIQKGDKVRVDDAKQEIRHFEKQDGSFGEEIRLSYGSVKLIERKADRVTVASGKPF